PERTRDLNSPTETRHFGVLEARPATGFAERDGHLRSSPVPQVLRAHLAAMETQQTPERGLDPLLSIDELADYLGLPVRTIYAWRTEGKGPRGVLLGKHVKFYVSDV